jgi:hypothetical protein
MTFNWTDGQQHALIAVIGLTYTGLAVWWNCTREARRRARRYRREQQR